MRNNTKNRFISGFLAGVMMLNLVPVFAAAEETGLCEHHTIHENCGYVEGISGSPCVHEHADCYILAEECVHNHVDCGFSEIPEENLCDHQCTKDSGCVTEQFHCVHEHDDGCGYREEVVAQPCAYECQQCAEANNGDPATVDVIDDQTVQIVDSGACGENLTWTLNDAGILTISGNGNMYNYTFDDSPWKNLNVNEIEFTGEITNIGDYAFNMCQGLTEITIPDTVTKIGEFSFNGCMDLESIILSKNLENIHNTSFIECPNLKTLQIDGSNSYFYTDSKGVLYNKEQTILIKAPSVITGGYEIPDSVIEIADNGFFGCSELQSIIIPDSVTKIGDSVFYYCIGLSTVSLPESVQSLGNYLFSLCENLTTVNVPASITEIRKSMFNGCCALSEIKLPDSITKISENAFNGCSNLSTIKILDNVSIIADSAFSFCNNLNNIIIPENVTSLGRSAFRQCYNLRKIHFLGDAPIIDDDSFASVMAEVYYPVNNETWTTDVMQDYGGTISWLPLSEEHTHDYVDDICTVCGELHPRYVPLDSVEWNAKQVMSGTLYQMNLRFADASLGITYGDNIDQFDAELRETLLQEYYKGSPAVVLVDGAYFYVGRGDGGNITYTTDGKNVYVNCEDYIDLTFKRTSEKQLTVIDSNLENLIGLILNEAAEETPSGINCPYTETFDLAGISESHSWIFTPQKSGQYVISLDNLDNPNYGMCADIKLTQAGKDFAYDKCSIQTKFSRYVYSLEAGTEYVIQTEYYGTDPLTDIKIRIDEAVEPQDIKLEYEKLNLYYHPQREEHAYPITAELIPWNAVGSISWESSNPDIMYAGYSEYLVTGAGYGNQPGTVTITATCGEHSDSVEVNIHNPIELELNTPFKDTCVYDQSKRYIYTAEEAGKYHIKIDADIEYYIYADEHTPFENAGSKDWFATLEEGQFICFEIDGMTSASNGSTYTITVNKATETQKLALSLKPVYGNSLQADVIFTPQNSIEEITTWELSDESILQTGAAGGPVRNWYILENGEVTVTVTSESGLTASSTVVVGTCGKYLCWMIDEEGTLTINGSGAMDAIGFDSVTGQYLPPWKDWQDRIKSVVIESGVTDVADQAFGSCKNLETIVIPETVKKLGDFAILYCPSLKEIQVDDGNQYYCTVEGVLYSKDMATLIKYPACRPGTEYTVPDTVTKLMHVSFDSASKLVSITLPDNIIALGTDTFADCTSLKNIRLPKNLTDMEAGGIFWNCSCLESIEIPDNVQVIGSSAFAYCSNLKQVTLPVGLKKLDGHAFGRCENLETITIPTGVNCLEYKIFEGSGLQSIIFEGDAPNFHEETFTDITATAYYPADNVTWTDDVMQDYGGNITWKPSDASGVCGDNLTWTFTGDTLTITGNGTMYDYSQDQVNLAPWTYLGNYIKNLVIEEGVTRIGDFAFVNCSVIEKAIFPSTLKHVGEYAFYKFIQTDGNIYHKPFKSEVNQTVRQWLGVNIEADNEGFPCWDIVSFINVSPIVASGKVGDNVYWEFREDGTMELFGTGAMYEFGATASPRFVDLPVKDIVIGEGITTIGMNIFEVMESASLAQTFESITIASTIKKVEEMAFTGCRALKTITFTGNAPSFGGNCFRDVKATAYYPAGNATWTSAVMQNYDGNITWVPYCLEHSFGDWITEGTNSHKTCFHCGYTEHKVVTDSGDVEIEIPEQPDLEVEVDPVLPSEDNYVLVEEVLDSTGNQNQAILKVFDINLINSDGVHVQPSGTVKVKLPLNSSKNGNYKVYRVNDDGTLTNMNAYRQGNHMVFETDHFSLYVIVDEGHGHNYQPIVTAPTCTENGFTTYTCGGCGSSYVDDEVAALGHSYDKGKVTTKPTCMAEGVKTFTCGTCGDTKTEPVEKDSKNHSFTKYESDKNATCKKNGTKTAKCDYGCGETNTVTDRGSKLGHKYQGDKCIRCGVTKWNPDTGDKIMIAVTVLAVSGSALLILLFRKKRK